MIVECRNLTKRFRHQEAVRDLTLSVPQYAALALVGANGAGKSTTLRMMLNILAPDSGSARVLGVDSVRLRENELKDIGYVCCSRAPPTTAFAPGTFIRDSLTH